MDDYLEELMQGILQKHPQQDSQEGSQGYSQENPQKDLQKARREVPPQNLEEDLQYLLVNARLIWNAQDRPFEILLIGSKKGLQNWIDFFIENMIEYSERCPVKQENPLILEGRLNLGTRKVYHVRIEHQEYNGLFENTFNQIYGNNNELETNNQNTSPIMNYDGILISWNEDSLLCDLEKAEKLVHDKWTRTVGYFDPKESIGSDFHWIFDSDGEEYWEIKIREFFRQMKESS